MNCFYTLFQNSEKLKNLDTSSHAFYIAEDVEQNAAFFPSKRIPLAVGFESGKAFDACLNKLIVCYCEDKAVSVVSENGDTETDLKNLKTEISQDKIKYPFVLILQSEKLTESRRFDFSDLVEIMTRLRGEGGCEWDRAQTHESIRINLIEEAYELVEAIDKADRAMLLEETGDVLLQAVFHTHIEQDKDSFGYVDMLSALCNKLLTRHTHIFGENHADNAEQALNFWNAAKKIEKGYTSESNAIDLIPKNLPSLLYAYKVQKKASKAGFDWKDISGAVDKVSEELSELLAANEQQKELEGGDLLFSVVNVLRFLKIEPELALKAATYKFARRFELVEKELAKQDKAMRDCTLEEIDAVYNSVKNV